MTVSSPITITENNPGLQIYFPDALVDDSLCPLASGDGRAFLIPHIGLLIVPEQPEDLFPMTVRDPTRIEDGGAVSSVVDAPITHD